MADYRLNATPASVTRTVDGACIPNNPSNGDWLTYQAWLADGGVPDPYSAPLAVDPLDMKTAAEILNVGA
jgi:hypothetical protein